jgi:tape measure domain-containing protein
MKDQMSPAINSIRNAGNSLNKDLERLGGRVQLLESRQEALSKKFATSQQAINEAQKRVQLASKEFKKLGENVSEAERAAKKFSLEQAVQELTKAKNEAAGWKKELSESSKEYAKLYNEQSKIKNRAVESVASEPAEVEKSLVSSLASSGLKKMLSGSFSEALKVGVSSAFGSSAGSAISTVASKTVEGATLGSVIPGIGTAVGAGLGAAAGGIEAAMQYFTRDDDAYKAFVQEQVGAQNARTQADLASGSSLAASRETMLNSFTTLFAEEGEESAENHQKRTGRSVGIRTGKEEAKTVAEAYLGQLKTMDRETPFNFDGLAQLSKVFKTYGYEISELIPNMKAVGDAGSALGMNQSDMETVAAAIGRMHSSDKTTLEYIMPLQERGIDAIGALAAEFKMSQKDVYEAISKGTVSGVAASDAIADYMQETYAGSMDMQSKTFEGLNSSLEGAMEEMQAAMGEGYNAERGKGIQAQIDYLDSDSGKKMQDANRLIGAYQASLENLKEELVRQYEGEALAEIEEKGLEGAEAGRVLAEARIKAQAEYNASEGAKAEVESQRQLIENVQEMLVADRSYYTAGQILGEQFSKGIASAALSGIKRALSNPEIAMAELKGIGDSFSIGRDKTGIGGIPEEKGSQDNIFNRIKTDDYHLNLQQNDRFLTTGENSAGSNHAAGLDCVPFDGYPARLHQGERVLTAREARAENGFKSRRFPFSLSEPAAPAAPAAAPSMPITVNFNGSVRDESDIDAIASALVEKIRMARQIT